jgi:CubicO group peptidase (beta-lactamase class C family)
MAFQAYHGVSAAQHQANFNKFFAEGYRIISLSVYGDPGNALYAAVWVQREGPGWVAVHGVDSAGYQAFFNKWTAQGFVPILVSATGTISDAIFAAVFEQGVVTGPWFAKHGMTSGAFQDSNAAAAAAMQIIRSVAIYGAAADRRYAAIWHPNPVYVKSHVHPSDTGASYQVTFNAETQLPGYRLAGYRPAYVALSSDVIYCSLFKDDVVGPWVARHGMTGSEYQTEFNQQVAKGFYPICTQGGGTTSAPVYAAIFAQEDIPLSRQWTVTGAAVPALAVVDQAMHAFMQGNGVRAAQVAIAKNGVAKSSRGYTWAEPGYRTTQPSDRFLLASCSKMFLEGAVQSLYNSGALKPSTAVYPLLGFSNPADARSDTITIQQLLDHQGGYNDGRNPSLPKDLDPTYSMRQIALALNPSSPVPVTKLDVARYMYGRSLQYTPGTNSAYSNYGYLLAGAVVEHVTNMKYFNYVKQALLQPAGIGEVQVFSTLAANRTNNEAIAEDQGLHPSAIELTSNLNVPDVYGGDGEINEVGDPNDGLSASAEAMAQFIFHHAVWGNGPRSVAARAGSTPGASTWAESRSDGVDWAYTINTRDWPAAPLAFTTAKGAQPLTQSSFTLPVNSTGGFPSSGALLVTNSTNANVVVQYTGVNSGANTFTGCAALFAGGGATTAGGAVSEAAIVIGAHALAQSSFTLTVSSNGTRGFTNSGMLAVTNSSGAQVAVRYTGVNPGANAFTGCSALLPGGGSATTGGLVAQSLPQSIDALLNSISLP